MWKRLRRRTMAPSRPMAFPDQIPLLVLVVLVLIASIALAIWGVTR
jgi:hypothetical protein